MANPEHLAILKQGVEVWNEWRKNTPAIKPNLRGAKLRDKHLEGANFSNADIRSTDFTNAKLQGADFTGVTAGLQKRWAILWVVCSWLLAGISGLFSASSGYDVSLIFSSQPSFQITGWVTLIMLVVFLFFIIRQGTAGGVGAAVAVAAVAVAAGGVGAAVVGGGGAAVVGGGGAAAAVGAVAAGGAAVVVGAVVVAVVAAGAVGGGAAAVGAVGAVVVGAVVVGTGGGAAGLVGAAAGGGAAAVGAVGAGAYVAWRAIKGDRRDVWVRDFAVAFAATGGTSFRGTNLTDANFTDATLKNTDFRTAILTRICWKNAQKLDLVRPGDTYLQKLKIQQWLIGQGKDKNFNRLDLRGINFQGYNLTEASFIGADLSEANLQDADLSRARLVQTQVDKTDFTGATLTGSVIEDWGITADTILRGVKCDYVFMRLPPEKRPNWLKLPPEESLDENPRRKPDNWQKNFEEGEFEDFITPLVQTLDLYHNHAVDLRLVAIALKDLQQAHPEADIEYISYEKKGKNRDKLHVKAATSPQADKSALYADHFDRLDYLESLPPEAQQALLIERGATLPMLFPEGLKITINNYPNQANQQNQANNNMTDNRDIKINKGNHNENIEGDYMEGNSYSITGDNNQAVQGDNNQVTQQNRVDTDTGEEITQAKVIELLAELEQKILSSGLPEETKQKTLNRLSTVTDDAKEPEPDKKLVSGNLKKVTETLKVASESTEEAKKLWHNIQPILEIVGTWLGVGIQFL